MKISNTAIMCLSVGRGGMEIDAIKTASLLNDDLNIHLICKSGSYIAERIKKKPINGLNVIELSFNSKLAIGFIDFRLLRQLRETIKKYEISNLIFFGVSELKTIFFSLIGKDTKLIIRHGTKKSKPKKDILRRILFGRVNLHVAISNYIANNVKDIYPVSKKSEVVVIYPSLGLPMNHSYSKPSSSVIRILHTGRVVDGKGYENALDACDILYDNDLKFEFTAVGDMPESDYVSMVKKKVSAKKHSSHIKFTGHVEDVNNYLVNSDILLFPSKGEGFCNSFNEALAYGLVCLAYENTVFPELRDIGFYFHLADNGDLLSLANELLLICNNLENEKEKCLPNISLAQKLYSPAAEKNAYMKILT